jgi:hypothetical protein
MTTQESFKRRIRQRMAKTGERYGAARRALIPDQGTGGTGAPRVWVSDPEMSEERIRAATGRGWDEWCDDIEAWLAGAGATGPGDHPAIAAYVQHQRGIDAWWAQSITVGFERITGRRVRHQRRDGSFEVSASRTARLDADLLRSMLLDDTERADLFPPHETTLRSRPSAKALRIGMPEGLALFTLVPGKDGRVRVTVAHSALPSAPAAAAWREYWQEWLAALAS